MKTRANMRWLVLAGAAFALLFAGCLEEKAPGFDCGTGDDLVFAGDGFCVYSSALIIEGFLCPEARPFEFDGPGGERICGPRESLPDGGIDGVIDAWKEAFEPNDVDTVDTILDTTDTGDTEPDSDTPDTSDTSEPGSPSLCLADHARGIGAFVPIGQFDTACEITAECGAGEIMVRCGDTSAFCSCDFGDQQCVQRGSPECPAKAVTQGGQCFDGYGLTACADGLVCSQPFPTSPAACSERPELCTSTACFDTSDCPDNEDESYRCYGGNAVNGTAGRCRPQVFGTDCFDATDCAVGFQCVGATFCGPCETCDLGASGTCEAGTSTVTEPFIQPSVPRVGVPQRVYWMASDTQQTYVACPSITIEARDEVTLSWAPRTAITRAACDDTTLTRVDGLLEAPSFTVTAVEQGYLRVRARGRFYTGCTGDTVASCSGGPIERFTNTMIILP
ncbi:MAG: hypothetical protein ACI9WU_004959 [Myxococcota bacterium]|jgi:hypothetical protein